MFKTQKIIKNLSNKLLIRGQKYHLKEEKKSRGTYQTKLKREGPTAYERNE